MMFGFLLLIIVVFWLFSSNNPTGTLFMNHQSRVRNSLDILNDRYARGEINREEYLDRKRDLSMQ